MTDRRFVSTRFLIEFCRNRSAVAKSSRMRPLLQPLNGPIRQELPESPV